MSSMAVASCPVFLSRVHTCSVPDLQGDSLPVLELDLLCDKVGSDGGLVCVGEPSVDELCVQGVWDKQGKGERSKEGKKDRK